MSEVHSRCVRRRRRQISFCLNRARILSTLPSEPTSRLIALALPYPSLHRLVTGLSPPSCAKTCGAQYHDKAAGFARAGFLK